MYQKYKEKAEFFILYIREAHPARTEERASAEREQGRKHSFARAKDLDARAEAANACLNDLGLSMTFLLDDMEGSVEKAYAGWPNRIYVIDLEGKVAMKGRKGPGGCDIPGAEKALQGILEKGGP